MQSLRNDSNGQEILVNDIVAYNLSGDVVGGIVENITPHFRRGRPGFTFHIKCVWGAHWQKGRVSKVLNGRSILIIERKADERR